MSSSTPEGKVKARVKQWWKRVCGWFYMPVQTGMGVVGIPDFVGCIPTTITQEMVGKRVGLFVAVECKAPGKLSNVTANQQFQIGAIRDAGGIAVVVDDAEQLEGLLSGNDSLWGK